MTRTELSSFISEIVRQLEKYGAIGYVDFEVEVEGSTIRFSLTLK